MEEHRRTTDSMSGPSPAASRSVLVTGASGLVGRQVVRSLVADRGTIDTIVAADLRELAAAERLEGVVYRTLDVRDPALADVLREHEVDTVVHLAAVVTPGRHSSRELEYSIDVEGTRNVIEASISAGVRRLIYTSSGAAYGYHADNPPLLVETDPLRGNPEFPYAHHKHLAEEMLARCRKEHPELVQLVLRPGTILGSQAHTPITALFEQRVVVGVAGTPAPFVFVWDEDVARCIVQGLREGRSGIYNLAGDGAITLREIARRLGKPYLPVPAAVLRGTLALLRALGLSARGPEGVEFLRHRPVLGNARLKAELGFTPAYTSEQCFERYRSSLAADARPGSERIAVVTGAASGIGAAIARRLARGGFRVALLDVDVSGVARLAAELEKEGWTALALRCDVTSAADCQAAMGAVRDAWGRIDLLVNDAGITQIGRFRDTDATGLRKVMDVNFFGAVHCTRAALEELLARRGQIVVISSVAGFAPLVARAGYAASKHALHGFFETLRAEHRADGLGVLLVCPSFVETHIGEHALGADGGEGEGATRPGVDRPIPPEEVADAVFAAVEARRDLLLVPRRTRLAYWAARLAPRFYERRMVRQVEG